MTPSVHTPGGTADIGDLLRSHAGGLRLRGSGSRQHELPASGAADILDLSRLDAIVRLDPGDQTCTVECGVDREVLGTALHEVGLELPCLGGGTVAGLFANDPHGPAAAGGQSPRSLLLGMEAVLSDGTAFRSGARVVKSVAGFDVHKLLVGSNGRLFVATQLHLRLKPRPSAEQWFRNAALDAPAALDLLTTLRQLAAPLAVLQVRRERDGTVTVLGRVVGRSSYVQSIVNRHGLEATSAITDFAIPTLDGEEVVRGTALPSALPQLLLQLPDHAPFTWLGGGRFETALANATATDTLLRYAEGTLPASIVHGPAARRGRCTSIDAGQQRLADGLKRTLDPGGVLV